MKAIQQALKGAQELAEKGLWVDIKQGAGWAEVKAGTIHSDGTEETAHVSILCKDNEEPVVTVARS